MRGQVLHARFIAEPEIRVLVKQGKATILITGNGTDAVGSKTAKFTITTMRMNLFKLIFGE